MIDLKAHGLRVKPLEWVFSSKGTGRATACGFVYVIWDNTHLQLTQLNPRTTEYLVVGVFEAAICYMFLSRNSQSARLPA